MSKIAVVIDDDPPANAIQKISQIVKVPLLELKKRVAGRQPVVECVLFRNNYFETFRDLRELVSYLTGSRLNFRLFELNEQLKFASIKVHEKEVISVEALEEILKGFESERKRFGS